MLRPMMNAPAAVIFSIASALASGCSNIHRCSRSAPSPSGSSSRWFGLTTKPSTEIPMSQVTLPISLPLVGRPSGATDE